MPAITVNIFSPFLSRVA
jgi:hypothetical protein